MASIILFKGCKALPDKNFIIEDLDTYLNTLTKATVNNFTYVKNDLTLTLKFNLDQVVLDGYDEFGEYYNYAAINNSDSEQSYYYFITKMNWKAHSTVELELRMDVLNTFDGQYSLGKKTTIEREHKDRWVKSTETVEGYNSKLINTTDWVYTLRGYTYNYSIAKTGTVSNITYTCSDGGIAFVTVTAGSINILLIRTTVTTAVIVEVTYDEVVPVYTPCIDFTAEGINPVLYHNETEDVEINDESNQSWYLAYYSDQAWSDASDSDNPVKCAVFPENGCYLKYNLVSRYITPSSFEAGKKYALFPVGANLQTGEVIETIPGYVNYTEVYVMGSNSATGDLYTKFPIGTKHSGIHGDVIESYAVFYLENNTISVEYWQWLAVTGFQIDLSYWVVYKETGLQRVGLSNDFTGTLKFYEVSTDSPSNPVGWFNTGTIENIIISGASGSILLDGIDKIDRTNSQLNKIIKLPYCPATIGKDGNVLELLSGNWAIDNQLPLGSYNETTETFTTVNGLAFPLSGFTKMNSIITDDNFNPLETLEKQRFTINTSGDRDDTKETKLLHSEFYQPRFTYDSFNFNFQLENADTDSIGNKIKLDVTTTSNSRFMFTFPDYKLKKSTIAYSNYLPIARNNEITLLNSAYLNYLRNGYNYDVKQKNRNIEKGWVTTGLSALTGGIVGGMKGGGAGAIAGFAGGAIGSTVNNLYNQVQAEETIHRKLQETGNQAVAMTGSDDIDLLDAYSNNRAKIGYYECSENVKSLIADLFYYGGYKCGVRGTPNLDSRYWFNYCQCDAEIEEPNNMGRNIIDEIKLKYKEGVTKMHRKHNTYDFDQEKENWEVSLING